VLRGLKHKFRAFGRKLWRSLASHVPLLGDGDVTVPKGRTHVILLDGTLSSLRPGYETSIGLIFRLLGKTTAKRTLYYAPGLHWGDWRSNLRVLTGQGLGHQIRQAYGALAMRYADGDEIFIFGYSRGAFAARSLCGMIDEVGLLRADAATPRNIATVWRLYQAKRQSPVVTNTLCRRPVPIKFLGVLDTVSALGLRIPILWRFLPNRYSFHSHHVCDNIQAAFHALALDETRLAYAPECWDFDHIPLGTRVEQVWFRGSHGDIGGHLGDAHQVRPLSNIPLTWLLERAEEQGLDLPDRWRDQFPTDITAPSLGTWRGVGRFLLFRAKRRVALSDHEWIHPSIGSTQMKEYLHD
jgi:uncharacterized protein (DUF2235 family)